MNSEQGKDYLSMTDEMHPVRNSREQKEAFRAYALAEAEKNGIASAVREDNEGHVNLVFGDAGAARLLFTAHYDTPRRSLLPNMMLVTNPVLHWGYVFGVVLIIVGFAVAAAFAAKALLGLDWDRRQDRFLMLGVYMLAYFALFFLMMRGPANRRNRNDNTSGTAAVLELTRRLGDMKGVAYVLFDDEEKGKKGSKAYAAAHPLIRQNALAVNLDCVGNGDTFVFSVPAKACMNPLYEPLKAAAVHQGLNARFFSSRRAQMNSDHKSFEQGIGVCACRHKPVIGYYTGRIHTSRDTVADPQTVARLADALAAFAEACR